MGSAKERSKQFSSLNSGAPNTIVLGMNLALAFAQSIAAHNEKTAVFWGEQEISYGALGERAQAMAGELQGRFNVRQGDRVGLWLKNCP